MASPPKRKPTKVPLLPDTGARLDDYVQALHPSLFTNPSYFTPASTLITGSPSLAGVIVGTAREMFLAILVSGGSVAADGATVTAPLRPVAPTFLSVAWTGPPTVDMPPATMDAEGVISLPPWSVYGGDVLITGIIQEA